MKFHCSGKLGFFHSIDRNNNINPPCALKLHKGKSRPVDNLSVLNQQSRYIRLCRVPYMRQLKVVLQTKRSGDGSEHGLNIQKILMPWKRFKILQSLYSWAYSDESVAQGT